MSQITYNDRLLEHPRTGAVFDRMTYGNLVSSVDCTNTRNWVCSTCRKSIHIASDIVAFDIGHRVVAGWSSHALLISNRSTINPELPGLSQKPSHGAKTQDGIAYFVEILMRSYGRYKPTVCNNCN